MPDVDEKRLHVVAGTSAAAVVVLLVANFATWFPMLDWDPRASEPDVFLSHAMHHIALFRVTGMFDFLSYLAIVPLVLVLWDRAGGRGVAASIATAGGLAFAGVGGAGAAALLVLWPHVFAEAARGSASAAEVFRASWYVVPRAIWNGFDAVALGTWFVWAGARYRANSRLLAGLGLAAGVLAFADVGGLLAGFERLAEGAQVAWGFVLTAFLVGVAVAELRRA